MTRRLHASTIACWLAKSLMIRRHYDLRCGVPAAASANLLTILCVLGLQEKANQEAAAAKAAGSQDPLAPAPAPQRHEVSSSNKLCDVLRSKQEGSLPHSATASALALLSVLARAPLRICMHGHCQLRQLTNVVCMVQDFPPLPADGEVKQRNEGRWDFTLQESDDG